MSVCVCVGRKEEEEEGAKSHSLRRRHPRFCAAPVLGEAQHPSWRGGGQRPWCPGAVLEPCRPLRPFRPCARTEGAWVSCGRGGVGAEMR